MAKKKSAKKSVIKKAAPKKVAPKKRTTKSLSSPQPQNQPIIAICDNANCGNVWIDAGNAIGNVPGGRIILTRSKLLSCPVCGTPGTIPDGEYTTVSAHLFQPAQFDKIYQAVFRIRDQIQQGAREEEVRNAIAADPNLKWLVDLITPKTYADVINTILVIVGIVTAWQQSKNSELSIPKDLHDAIVKMSQDVEPPHHRNRGAMMPQQTGVTPLLPRPFPPLAD